MKKKEPATKRIQKFLKLWSMELALTSGQPTLRDAEKMTKSLGLWAQTLVPASISDSTLDTESQRLNADYLLEKLVQRVRGFHRSKMLAPVSLPCGVVTVDGKNLATLYHDADGTGHRRSKKNEKWHLSNKEEKQRGKGYFLMPALRAVLSSAEATPCIYQLPLPAGKGESTMFPEIVGALNDSYGHGDMFRILDMDAGLTSFANAKAVITAGYDYVMGLKGNQQELFAEAQSLLLPMTQNQEPQMQTPWESRNGKRMRRRLWRTDEMEGIRNSVGKWTHLKQTWLVRQETRGTGGRIEIEDRFFITSLPWDFLTPAQICLLVRKHWAVEITFNSLDLQWREDPGAWCTQGTAVWCLGLLRLLAYNTAQMLRRRRRREKKKDKTLADPMDWRSLFKAIENSLSLDILDPQALCTG